LAELLCLIVGFGRGSEGIQSYPRDRDRSHQNNHNPPMTAGTKKRLKAAALLLVAIALTWFAKDVLHGIDKAGVEPGGALTELSLQQQEGAKRYQLRLLPIAKEAYHIGFFDRQTNAQIGIAETAQGGITTAANAADLLTAVWHPSGTIVAFNDRATRHSLELYVYAIRDGKPVRLAVDDYVQNALGRVGAVEPDLTCVSTPLRWDGTSLTVKLQFSASIPATGRLQYVTLATLSLSGTRLRLQSVEPPQPAHP
jgi:hypothetical protein